MDYLSIDGIKPYDGRYEFDIGDRPLNTREWGWIKRHSGYLPLTIDEGIAGSDPELYVAFAVIALHRAGKIDRREVGDVYERIAEAPFGSTITLESPDATDEDDEEVDDGPPALSSIGSSLSSGAASITSSEISDASPSPSGTSGSDASESPRQRSAI